VQVLQEFFVTVTLKVPKPMSSDDAADRVRDLGRWTVFAPSADDVLSAIALARQHRLSFWDAMIVEAASQLGCNTLWTEDLQDGLRLRGVLVRNPFAA
jgi:predicted nucleic acid-binding protein